MSIDTSAYSSNRYPKELVDYLKHHGQNKVMFGTNYPMISPSKCLEDLKTLQLGEKIEQKFLYQNAVRVFQLDH